MAPVGTSISWVLLWDLGWTSRPGRLISYAHRAGILLGLDSGAPAGEVQVNGG